MWVSANPCKLVAKRNTSCKNSTSMQVYNFYWLASSCIFVCSGFYQSAAMCFSHYICFMIQAAKNILSLWHSPDCWIFKWDWLYIYLVENANDKVEQAKEVRIDKAKNYKIINYVDLFMFPGFNGCRHIIEIPKRGSGNLWYRVNVPNITSTHG